MTPSLCFLTLADIFDIHLYQLEHFGGISGTRDLDLLKSAVAMPQMSFGGVMLHKNIFEMAAAYLFHIVQNHPFLDGNKRTGAMAALVFLDINGYEFTATDADLTQMVFKVASGQMEKAAITLFLKNHCSKKALL